MLFGTFKKNSRVQGFFSFSVPLELLMTAIALLIAAIVYGFRH